LVVASTVACMLASDDVRVILPLAISRMNVSAFLSMKLRYISIIDSALQTILPFAPMISLNLISSDVI